MGENKSRWRPKMTPTAATLLLTQRLKRFLWWLHSHVAPYVHYCSLCTVTCFSEQVCRLNTQILSASKAAGRTVDRSLRKMRCIESLKPTFSFLYESVKKGLKVTFPRSLWPNLSFCIISRTQTAFLLHGTKYTNIYKCRHTLSCQWAWSHRLQSEGVKIVRGMKGNVLSRVKSGTQKVFYLLKAFYSLVKVKAEPWI